MGVKRKNSMEVATHLPYTLIDTIDDLRGPYISRSRFIYWAISEFLKERKLTGDLGDLIDKVPRGVKVTSQTPQQGRDSLLSDAQAATTPTAPGGVG